MSFRMSDDSSKIALTDTVAHDAIANEALANRVEHEVRPVLEPGTVIKHYELIRELGAGGMGMVFLARDTRLARLVAIKFLLEHTGAGAERFLVEARTTALCRHENIVVIYDVDEINGFPYMVLEYIEGRTLRSAMSERARDTASAVEVMVPVARALACAHAMGIIHRDLKPENILLANSGQVKVVDFGIAKQIARQLNDGVNSTNHLPMQEPMHEMGLTQDGALVGTMPYMSPEQWRYEPLDTSTDIWAAGIILFELATGTHPLEPLSFTNLFRVADSTTPMPSARDKLVGAPALADVIDRCLKKHKEERFGSATLLADALENLGADKHPEASSEDENPFAGLAAFQESDAARFFGRDADIDATIGKLRHHQLVAIAGPSGVGKSSFVRAGVIPALKRAGRQMEAFVVRPGRHPLVALADVLGFFADTAVDAGALDESTPAAVIADILKTQPGYLGSRLRARCRKRGNDHRILLFVDQLEELFTLGIDVSERAAFCACLEGVADDASSPLRVIVTIRADFIDRLADERRFLNEMTRGLLFLPPIGREGLRDALKKPIEAAGYKFEDDQLADEMQSGLDGTKSPLPILQFTASKLWEARDRENKVLTRAAYRAIGGVAGALSTHADAVLEGLSLSEQRLARSIFLRLVTIDQTRAIVQWDEFRSLSEDMTAVEQVVDYLADARLLSIERDNERAGKTVELVHESLIETWEKYRVWLDENAQDAQFLTELRTAALQWEKNGEAPGFLWRDRAAVEAGSWLTQRRKHLNADGTIGLGKREERYLEAVVRLMETARRRQWQVIAALIAGLSMVIVVVSTLAFQSKRAAERAEAEKVEAQAQRVEAERSATRARNATRMAAARERQHDPTTALALLREIEPESVPTGWAAFASWTSMANVASVVLQHDSAVSSASFSPDNTRIATISWNELHVWNADGTGQPLVLEGEMGGIVAWSPDAKRIVTALHDNSLQVLNADGTGQPLELTGHEDRVTRAAFRPDGTRIVSASHDKMVRVWNADGTGRPLVLAGHENAVNRVAWSPDGNRIASASDDKTVRVWNADGTDQPLVLTGHDDRVNAVAWSPDGKFIVSGSYDKTIAVWNADGSQQPRIFKGHDNFVTAVAWSPDNTRIASASGDTTVRVWNADGSSQPLVLRGHNDSVYDVAFSPDSTRVLSASLDNTARVWNMNRPAQRMVFQGHDDHVYDAAYSVDGQRIVSAACDKTVRVWNADGSGRPLVLQGHEDRVYAAVFSPDDQRIVSGSRDRTLRVWNANGTGLPIVLQGHDSSVNAAAFSPDGKRIVSGSSDKTIRVWNSDGSDKPLVLQGHEDRVFGAAWSPDGTRIASCAGDKTVRVWNADGKGQPLVLRGHTERVNGVAFSPDGKRILSASNDKTVRIWNADGTGQPLVLDGHHGEAFVSGYMSFSPDGKHIVVSYTDGTVLVWNADGTGEPLTLRASNTSINSASWSPDGKHIVGASEDNSVIVWSDLEPLQSPADARLWTPTSYCMSLEVRQAILDFSDAQSRKDLDVCQRRVNELRLR
jgi:WD40 repeat protein/serine/threonine protein kinase